jgi:glucose 1-dehydrogenase
MEINLASKRALVTGGSSGIGEAIVRRLSADGAKVGINFGHHAEPAEALLRAITDAGGEGMVLRADVAKPGEVAGMFARMDENWGGIDILINNAGIDGKHDLGWESDLEAWRSVLEVNLFGAYHCCREALKRMVPQSGGVILNITSVHETIAWSGYSAYCASKAGLGMLTKTLAQEASPHGIRVLAVAPGAIKTPINRAVWSDPEGMRDLLGKIPLNRVGEAEEVARMVAVLVSDIASYVTGTTLFVDGGMTDYPGFMHGG